MDSDNQTTLTPVALRLRTLPLKGRA